MAVRLTRLLAVSALAAVTLSASGCGFIAQKAAEKASEKAVEDATGAKVDLDDDKVTIESTSGAFSFGGDQKLPDGFPKDVPVREGAKIVSSMTNTAENGDTWIVNYETADAPAAIYDWSLEQLEAEGWKVEVKAQQDSGGMISATKDTRRVSVTLGESNEEGMKTTVVVSVGPAN